VPSDSPKGRLIALEGAGGPALPDAGNRLVRSLLKPRQEGGVSQFDASGIFFELRKGEKNIPQPSPRTLLLLYAADLVFRLRWEIKPALEEGYLVVAAPYVDSAIAFGKAAGLSRRWLADLFDFAPKPHACYRLKEKRDIGIWKFKRSEGYLEFCCKTLLKSSPIWQPVELREKYLAYLEALEKRGGCETVSDRVLSR
jgi:thymidylate kinase